MADTNGSDTTFFRISSDFKEVTIEDWVLKNVTFVDNF
jgi:hypothetical protein